MSEDALWPGGAQCAVVLSFDFDAETVWLARDTDNRAKLATLSFGHYGAKVGVPKILELLREEALRATFFVPGWSAETYPERMAAIAGDGHEIAHHGYLHYRPDPADEPAMLEEIERGLETLAGVGVTPKGYRAPGGESCDFLLRLLVEKGIVYSSSFKDDVMPYRHRLGDGRPGPVEIPEQPALDDWNYGFTHLRSPQPLYTKDAHLAIWREEFREIYRWGGVFILVMHPQITGRPLRLAVLREFIAFTRRFPNVWYATALEVAEAFISREAAG